MNYKEEKRERPSYCNLTGVGFISYTPNDGLLTRPFGAIIDGVSRSKSLAHTFADTEKEVITRVESVPGKHSVSTSVIALVWLVHEAADSIVGFSKSE